MKKLVAVPTINKKLCVHFGHCEQFAVVETTGNKVTKVDYLTPPVHQPGTYPRFLADKGVSAVLAGGIGDKAKTIFVQNNIEVFMGVSAEDPEALVEQYLTDQLQIGDNQCDH